MTTAPSTRRTLSALLAALFMVSTAQGQTQAQANVAAPVPQTPGATSDKKKSEQIDVTATTVAPYTIDLATGATKGNTPLIETPQSVSIVTRALMDAQNVQSLSDVLRYVGGVTPQAAGRRGFDDFIIRGFSQSAFAFRDGLRVDPGFLTEQESFGLERVEVVKGPGSVLFGQVAPGGLVNMVSKQPTLGLAAPKTFVEGSVASYDATRIAADTQGAVNNHLAYRVVVLHSDREDAVDQVAFQRRYIAPSLTWRIAPTTRLTLLSLMQQDDFTRAVALPARGTVLPNPNGQIALNRFMGEPGFDRIRLPHWQAGYQFEHRISERLTFTQNLKRMGYQLDGQNNNLGAVAANGLTVGRNPIFLNIDNDLLAVDNQLNLKLTTGAVTHDVLVGLDYQRFRNRQTQRAGTVAALNLFNPVYGAVITPAAALTNNRRQLQTQEGVYLQNNMKIGGAFVLLAGLRRDSVRDDTTNYLNNARPIVSQSATSGRVGALWLAPGGFSPYVSVAESFVPVVANPLRDGSSVKPEEGAQTEVGIKWGPRDGSVQATLARFDLKRRNVVTADPTNAAFSVQVGEQRHKGWEAELNARVASFVDVVAAVSTLDAVVTVSTTGNQGKCAQNAPRRMASLWTTWRLGALSNAASGWDVSVGVRHVGEREGDALNTYKVPGYTVSDAAIRYAGDAWSVAFNVRNLADKDFFIGTSGATNVTVGERRTLSATVRYAF